MNRSKTIYKNQLKLFLGATLVGLLCSLLAFTLKYMTEITEHTLFHKAQNTNPLLFILLPSVGITLIYFLRKYAFKGKKNKGITEIYKTLYQRKDHLPFYKIPSHYINGFLTVIFGGSTGIEVSTVVASATVGNNMYEKNVSAKSYKNELICAGVAAGVSVLFSSPLAGFLFAMEVIHRRWSWAQVLSCLFAVMASCFFIYPFDKESIIHQSAQDWQWHALPYFLILALLGSALSVYFTLLVTRMKSFFSNINNNFIRVNLGAISVGLFIYFFPSLYGDSYHGLNALLKDNAVSIGIIFVIAILKPLMASLTLGAGGDGGVFAPSIVAGALIGLAVAKFSNTFFDAHLIAVNCMLIGAGAMLSASIYAPITSVFLICNIAPNGFELFFPLAIVCGLSYIVAKKIFPYNVYTYDFYKNKVTTEELK